MESILEAEIPFSTYSGYLKNLQPALFDAAAKKAVEYAFSEFFEAPRSDLTFAFQRRNVTASILKYDTLAPYRFRRFAGESGLPRGRYYSLSADAHGNDQGTLLRELLAYSDVKRTGPSIIFDGADEDERDGIAEAVDPSVRTLSKTAIIVMFIDADDRGAHSPIFRDGAAVHNATSKAIISLPYEVTKVSLERVIDLRLPSTARWLTESLLDGVPGTIFSYDNEQRDGLLLEQARPKGGRRVSGSDSDGEELVWGPRRDWDRKIVAKHDHFMGLLPFLVYEKHGGSPFTEAIGLWLRQLGATGLIYPSARSNLEVVIEDGEIKESGGWCFVDYRGLATPATCRWKIEEPDGWTSAVDYTKYFIREEPSFSGTWRLLGRDAKDKYDADQRNLAASMEKRLDQRQAQRAYHRSQLTPAQSVIFYSKALLARARLALARQSAKTVKDDVIGQGVSIAERDAYEDMLKRFRERNYRICSDGLVELIEREGLNDIVEGNLRAFRVFILLGNAEAKLARHELAISAFGKASRALPLQSEPHANIGNSFLTLMKPEEAVEAYATALRLNPADKVATANMEFAEMLVAKMASDRAK